VFQDGSKATPFYWRPSVCDREGREFLSPRTTHVPDTNEKGVRAPKDAHRAELLRARRRGTSGRASFSSDLVPSSASCDGNVHPNEGRTREASSLARAEFPSRLASRCLLSFTVDRFHVLFNPLFRVLFDFPSRYLSAIGLVGTCLALDGVYHPLFGLHSQAVRLFIFTPHCTCTERARTRTRGKTRPRRLLGACDASASDLRLAFTRSYSQDPGWFLFLRLLICSSSAGVRV
jgi:hypothetical protein